MAQASNALDEIIQLKPSELAEFIELCLASEMNMVPLILGGIGIGKSSIVRQAMLRHRAALPSYGYVELRTATMEPTDVVGIPMPDRERELTKWYLPEWLKLLPRDWQGVVFMDEFTKAMPSVTNAWSQPILDRHINGYPLPKGLRFVLAGNRRVDKSGDVDLGAFMYNRLTQVELVPDAKELATYFKSVGTRADLIGFLNFSEENIYHVQPDKKVHATPRTWEMVGHAMDECERNRASEGVRQAMVVGYVGKGPGFAYLSFHKMFSSIPPIDSVIANPDKAPVFEEMSIAYALALCLSRKAEKGNLSAIMRYLNRGPIEISAVFVNDMVARKPELKNTPEYIAWAQKHQDFSV